MPERTPGVSYRARLIVLAVTVMSVLVIVNAQILLKERIVRQGDTLLLRLAPRDPRSLLQGDYMALRYAMAGEVSQLAAAAGLADGRIVVERLPNGEAGLVGLYEDQVLSENQRLLRFRRRGESVRLASDAYFFEEGQWQVYADARFGEVRVDGDGDAVLTGLRDADGQHLGDALH